MTTGKERGRFVLGKLLSSSNTFWPVLGLDGLFDCLQKIRFFSHEILYYSATQFHSELQVEILKEKTYLKNKAMNEAISVLFQSQQSMTKSSKKSLF